MVNAKRMGVEIGRRFSATLDPASAAAAPATATPAGSAAPAATAPAASSSSSTGKATQRQNASGGRGGLADAHSATMIPPLPGSRNPFEKTVEGGGGGRGGKVEAAAELLARVRDQLERSEQRTKGLLIERQGVGDIAPPR